MSMDGAYAVMEKIRKRAEKVSDVAGDKDDASLRDIRAGLRALEAVTELLDELEAELGEIEEA
jgi:hypothetical protein